MKMKMKMKIQVIETTKNYEEKITDMSQSELLQYQKLYI